MLDDLEDVLITSDVGVNTTRDVIHNIEERVARDKYVGTSELNRILKEEIIALLATDGNTKENKGFEIPEVAAPTSFSWWALTAWVKQQPLPNSPISLRQKARK